MSQRFDPYGRRIARDSAGFTWGAQLRYGWTGREYDAETGFSFHRARYFDPASRRWTQEDPIGYGGGTSLYAYASGSPMEARDPSGMIPSVGETNRRLRAAAVDPAWAQGIHFEQTENQYNPFLPVTNQWSQTIYYDIYGNEQGRVANFHHSNRDIFVLRTPEANFNLDRALVVSSKPYVVETDESAWVTAARAAAAARIAKHGPACNDICFAYASLPGHEFDYKGDQLFPHNKLWNGGNGTYYHFDVVANTAWAITGREYGFSCGELRSSAQFFTLVTAGRADDPWDQFGIQKGC